MKKTIGVLTWAVAAMLVASCGISGYPGQAGRVTDGYSKIDLEFLDETGLWAYEVNYDNRVARGPSRVGAIITKLYPGAQTFTSNGRTNADGTLYWHKSAYQGAVLQMIATPKINQVIVPADSQVKVMLQYDKPLDEIDGQNLAEKGLFAARAVPEHWFRESAERAHFIWTCLRSGRLGPDGTLAYDVTAIELADKKFQPSAPVHLIGNFAQNAVRANVTAKLKDELKDFIETNFPKGYRGEAKIHLKDVVKPILIPVGVHTLKTAEAAGITVIQSSQEEMRRILAKL